MRSHEQDSTSLTRTAGSVAHARSCHTRRLARIAIVVLASDACARHNEHPELAARAVRGASTPADGRGTPAPPVVLVSGELAMAGPGVSLQEALQRLQPRVLDWRDRRTVTPDAIGNVDSVMPVVFVNGARASDLLVLRTIPARQVRKVLLLSPTDAVQRFGRGHEAGAILVTTLEVR